ncbi:SDR family oxidoreductase [SAR202 cluster bacterium AD-804-J14_MRT_500m]|nr:SDR family oxidoreductase [SAR202 cluster bacterium AD-804-J14_MRT_500m]
MDLELTARTAIVTGGSMGIGKAITRELALEGVDVVIAARGLEALTESAAEIAVETGRRIIPIQVDTSDDNSVKQMVELALSELGHVDILVNNAASPGGQGPVPSLVEITNEAFWEDLNVKVMGYIRCAREVIPSMKERGWGRIINISGMAARQSGSTIGSIRNVSVAAMTKNLADELGPHGINVTVVHPGLTRTEKTPDVLAWRSGVQGSSPEEVEHQMTQANSVRRFIDAREIAYVVTFLASPKASAITGDAVAAGGGVGRGIYY